MYFEARHVAVQEVGDEPRQHRGDDAEGQHVEQNRNEDEAQGSVAFSLHEKPPWRAERRGYSYR